MKINIRRNTIINKENVYKKQTVVESYNRRIYFGLSDGLLFKEEILSIIDWFDGAKVILDCPCGTGKLGLALKAPKYKDIRLYGSDISELMLEKARQAEGYYHLSIQNLLKTSYEDNFFDIVYVSRFFMLFHDIDPYLAEIKRILKPDGLFIFDSIRWSIHNIVHLFIGTEEGYNYPRSTKTVSQLLLKNGFTILERRSCFLLPTGIMNRLPKPLFKVFILLQKWLPEKMRVMEFYKVSKY